MAHRYPIGTEFMTRGKAPKRCVVVDLLTTTNSKHEVVRERYVAAHQFLGQQVVDVDVCDATIAIGISLLPKT